MKPACALQRCTSALLVQVGSLLGALVYDGTLTEEQASDLVTSAARASAGPGGSNTLRRLTRNMWAAVGRQRGACKRAEEQAEESKRIEAQQLAELHNPRVSSPFLLPQKKGCSLFVWVCHGELVIVFPSVISHYKLFLANLHVAWS